MIRVLHVVTILNRGGLETMLMNYYRNVDRNRIQFDFLVHRSTRGAYEDEIELLGGKIYRVSPISPTNICKYKRDLGSFFTEHAEYKIVHSHIDTLSTFVLRAADKAGVPVKIAHCHTQNSERNWKAPIRYVSKKILINYPDYFFACSKAAGEWAFGRSKQIQIIKNAIDAKQYIYNEEIAYQIKKAHCLEGKFVIGHVGNFTEAKNHSFLIDVFIEIHKKNNLAHLFLIGAGQLSPSVSNKIKILQEQNCVTLLGSRNDVPQLLQAMDIFVFPSIYEGLGIATIEAQASGLKVYASERVPEDVDITNLIKHIPLNKGAAYWAEKILMNCNNTRRNTYQEIVDAGYDIDVNAQQLQDFYLNLAGQPK